MFQMSIKAECCNKDVEQFFSSLSVGRNFNLFPIFIREPPQFKWSAVRHSYPFVGLVTIFFLMIRRPPRSTQSRSSAASDVYKRQVWHQRVWNSIWVLEQCLGSGTMSDIRNSGTTMVNSGHKLVTVSDFRNSTILKHYHQGIYMYMCPYNSSMSIANIQYFHNQRRWRIAVKQIQLGSTNVSDVNQGWML